RPAPSAPLACFLGRSDAMDTFWWRAAWALCLVQLSLAQIDLNITCRYKGVFHVEKNGRYSISKTEAADLCKAFNCTLPTMAQMEAALRAGFETCRYGFIDGHVVIPRIHPNSICAANNTGVYILTSNTSQYDTYCFNASVTSTVPSNSHAAAQEQNNWIWPPFGNSQPKTQDQTTTAMAALMSTSGTTSKTATKRQEAQDWFSWWFQPSASRIHLHTTTIMAAQPLMQVTTTGTDSNIISAGWEATEENEDESDRHPSYSGSDIDDDEDFISSTISTTPRVFNHPQQNEDWTQPSPGHSNPEVSLQTTTRMTVYITIITTDVDRSSTSAYGEKWTQETHSSLSHRGYHDEEETQHPTSTTRAPPTSTTEETATQKEQWFENGWPGEYPQMPKEDSHSTAGTTDVDTSHSTTLQPSADPNTGLVEDLDRTGPLSVTTHRNDGTGGRRGENLPEDSTTSVEGYTPYSPDTNEYRTLIPVTPAKTGSPEVTIVGDSTSNVDLSLSEDQDSPHDPSERSYTTHGSESAGHSSGSQERGANTTSGPMRKPQIPEWLIILASLLALALILAVCIAVNSRRRCGQKKKLVINNGNGTMEERKPSGLNGEASKSQEMVHLVNKESSETPDQFMTADERRNLQNVDMKIGV
ncbi:hypothetical protein EI555_019312, partial [Monodon monoceros]